MAKMVAGIDVLVLCPDEEESVAQLAVALGTAEGAKGHPARRNWGRSREQPRPGRSGSPNTRRRKIRGSISPTDPVSLTTTTARGSTIRRSESSRIGSYIERIEAGHDVSADPPRSSLNASRPPAKSRALPEENRRAFDESLALRSDGLPRRREPQLLH